MPIVTCAEFITSAVKPNQYPPAGPPEIAFAGRSNVGKSSLINCLVQRRHLVKTSRTPGRTQLINFFDIDGRLRFVDLPGYGYARVPERVRRQWGPMVETYLTRRETLLAVVLVMDIRRTPGEAERQFIPWLAGRRRALLAVLTKADKLTRGRQHRQQALAAAALGCAPEACICFSAKSRLGREALWRAITALTPLPPAGEEG